MIKSTRQYRAVPSFDEVMQAEQAKPIPSFDEVMGNDKKKATSGGSNVSSANTNLSAGGEKSQNLYDPVKEALTPLKNQLQQAQSEFEPLRNRAVSDQTRNVVLPTDVRNTQFQQSDFGVKQQNEKVANVNLRQAHSQIKSHLSNVSTAKRVLEDIKQKHGGVIPEGNETAQIVKPVSDSFDAANKDNKLVKSVADSKDVKDFVQKHSGAILPNQTALAAQTWEMANDPNIEEAFRRNPDKWKDFLKVKSDFNNSFPDVAKQRIASQVAQWREDAGQNSPIYNNPSKANLDKLVEDKYKKGDMNANDRAFYYQHIKPSDVPTTGFFNAAGRNYEQSTRNSFLGRALAGVGLMQNPKEKYEFAPNVTPTQNEISGGGGALAGQLLPIALTHTALKGAGFSDKAANIVSVVNQFGPTNQDKAEELFPKDPASKWAYTIAGSAIDALLTEIPILKGKSGALKSEAEGLSKVLADNTVSQQAKEQAKNNFLNRIKDFAVATTKNTASTAGILTGINGAHQLLDVAAQAPNAVKNLSHTNFVDEFIKNAKSAVLLGGAQAAGKLIPEGKTEAPNELHDAVKEIPDGLYTTPLKEAINSGDNEKVQTYLKNIAEQVKTGGSDEANTRKMFGDKISDIAVKLFPDAKGLPAVSTEPNPTRTEETTPIINEGAVGDNNIREQVDNSGGGEGVGGKTVEFKAYRFGEGEGEDGVTFSSKNRDYSEEYARVKGGKPEDVKEVSIVAKNPITIDLSTKEFSSPEAESKHIEEAKKNGNDLVIFRDKENGDEFYAQIKQKNERENINQEPYANIGSDKETNKITTNEIPIPTEGQSTPIKEPNQNIGEAAKGETTSTEGEKTTELNDNQGVPPTEPPTVEAGSGEEGVGIAHAATEEVRKKHGLGDYERNNATDAQLEEIADNAIKNGYNPETLISQMEKGIPPTGAENFILKKYLATLEAKVEKNPSDENIAAVERLVKATDKIGSLQSEAFRTRRGIVPVDDSLSGYFIREKDVNNGAPLTEKQKETVEKEYTNISESEKAYKDKIAKLEAENSKLKAEQEVKKTRASTPKNSKKTHEDYVKDRKDAIEKAREALKKIRTGESGLSAVPLPGVRELIAIAPHVKDAMKSYVLEGIDKLDDIVKKLHEDFKDVVDGLSEKNIHDIIAGDYNEKKQTRNELAEQLFNLRLQAKLENKLEAILKGEEPKSERQKIKRNQEIESLRKQIKDFKNGMGESLESVKKRTQTQIDAIEKQIKSGDFSPPQKRPQVKLDSEAVRLKDKLVKLKQEREIRIMKIQYANRSRFEKARDATLEVLNIPRTLMSSMDYSAPLRQSIIASVSHPRTSALAAIEMFRQSFSQKRFDRWFFDLKNDPRYEIMAKSGLSVSDPHDYRLSAKEEAFMNNLAEKIPVVGPTLIKGSERAYVGYLNKMRVDLFNRFAERFEEQGKTIENSPELYKALGGYINNQTGRGAIGKLENYAPMLNSVFFSPRLIAARLNLLNPLYYARLPKELRIMAAKDMLKFVALGTTVLALAKLNGAQVEDDPRSSDFGKIKAGNTRWDIWGGFQQYIRLFAQMAVGQKKSAISGEIQSLEGDGRFGETRGSVLERFARGKLAPVPSMAVDFLSGRTTVGDKTTVFDEATSHLLPLLYSDVTDAMKDRGISALFTVGIPSTFGVGVQTFLPKAKSSNGNGAGATGSFKKSGKSATKKGTKKATKK